MTMTFFFAPPPLAGCQACNEPLATPAITPPATWIASRRFIGFVSFS
jgi:hypothetical protein